MVATPGTIPSLVPYQPAALPITGQELVEIASTINATAAISGSMLITDVVGKAPSVMPGAVPSPSDVMGFYQGSSGTPRSASIGSIVIAGIPAVLAPAQRSIVSSGNLPILSSDRILNVNAVSDLTITVPSALSRNGFTLTFKNIVGSHSQTLIRSGSDTFDGQVTYPLTTGASVTLMPFNDGVNNGYGII